MSISFKTSYTAEDRADALDQLRRHVGPETIPTLAVSAITSAIEALPDDAGPVSVALYCRLASGEDSRITISICTVKPVDTRHNLG